MTNITLIEHAWELHKVGVSPDEIASKVGKDRATIFRWFAGIRLYGIRRYLEKYKKAKKGHRQKRKTDPITKDRIYGIREEFQQCCGEKIHFWMMKRYGKSPAITTIYRILGEKYILRSKWKRNQKRGPVPVATKPREVVQADTVDFGDIYAYTSIDICTREAAVVLKLALDMEAGKEAVKEQMQYFVFTNLLQKDGGSEFMTEWEKEARKYANIIRTSRPYRKNEQAYIESFNRTLRKECLGWLQYKKKDLPYLQEKLKAFLEFYNNERPHLSLGMKAPRAYLSHLR